MKFPSCFSLAFFLATLQPAFSADPVWWTTRGVKTSAPASNLSPAVLGQAKHMAAMALAELETRLPAPEFTALKAAVNEVANLEVFVPDPGVYYAPPPPGYISPEHGILMTGQLKALAQPFYDHLRQWNAVWLDSEMIAANLRVVEPGTNPATFSPYPWSVTATDDANKAIASLGQLKAVFSLRLETVGDTSPDTDGDGLSDRYELILGTNPLLTDTDEDGMNDGYEITHTLNPLSARDADLDPDSDTLKNFEEAEIGTNPRNPDTDGDSLTDSEEHRILGTSPILADSNSNGITDSQEDQDKDGLTNLSELSTYFTHPRKYDSDIDKLPDGWEVQYNLNPNDATGLEGPTGDREPDGLDNLREYLNQTDPNKADTDGDGKTDKEEVDQGSDPNDSGDGGNPPEDHVEVVIFELSGDYASWDMDIQGLGPRDTRQLKVVTENVGDNAEFPIKLQRNNKYRVTLKHTGSKDNHQETWFCWGSKAGGKPALQTFNNYQSDRVEGAAEFFSIADGHWLVDNRDGLFTEHNHRRTGEGGGGNVTEGMEAWLVPVAIEDNTHQGVELMTGVDKTSVIAEKEDIGYQNEYWIMAPCGGADFNNDMHFKIPADPQAQLKIESTDAVADPTTITLGSASPGPLVNWKGNAVNSLDHTPSWKAGEYEDVVELALKVKNMKRRTVKVAVWPINRPGVAPIFPDQVSRDSFISGLDGFLDEIFAYQVNAWFDVNLKDSITFDYADGSDNSGNPYLIRHGSKEKAMIDANRDPSVDINLYLIGNIDYLSDHPTEAISNQLGGSSYPPQLAESGNYKNCVIVNLYGLYSQAHSTSSHEIGHLLTGPGHPDQYQASSPNASGPAPLPSLASEHPKRLMYSTPSGERRLLVKAEWDAAEEWLVQFPDRRENQLE